MIIPDAVVDLYYYCIYLLYVVSTTPRGFGRTAITATSNNKTVTTTAITLGRHSTALNIADESSVEITNIRVHRKDRDSNGMIRVTMSLDVKANSINSSDPTVDTTKSSSMMDTISSLNSTSSYSALNNATSPTISLSPSSSSSSSSPSSSATTSSSMVSPSFQSKSRETTTTTTRIQPTVDEAAAPLRLLNQICRRRRARVIVIGDVHGCIDELGDLLRLAEYQPGDLVLFLGDLVAKGPNSV